MYYIIPMANVLAFDKQVTIIGSLAEGSSIRSIERMTGVHRDTIMRLGVKVGQGCAKIHDGIMRDLGYECIHVGEAEYRGQGVAQALLKGAIAYARKQGATLIEAYPVDKPGRSNDEYMWFGAKSMYDKAGFKEVESPLTAAKKK